MFLKGEGKIHDERRTERRGMSAYLFAWLSQAGPGSRADLSSWSRLPYWWSRNRWPLPYFVKETSQSQSPEPWDGRESSWAACSVCGVKNKPLDKGTLCKLPTSPTPSSAEQLSALISFSGSEILDSINCPIPLALFASPILGSGTVWWAVTAGWSDCCCPVGFSSCPDPWLTLLCLCPSFWSSCSWISYPCCLSPLLV